MKLWILIISISANVILLIEVKANFQALGGQVLGRLPSKVGDSVETAGARAGARDGLPVNLDTEDIRRIKDRLVAEGYPNQIISSVLMGILMDRGNYLSIKAAASSSPKADELFIEVDRRLGDEMRVLDADLPDSPFAPADSADLDLNYARLYPTLDPSKAKEVKAIEDEAKRLDMLAGAPQSRSSEYVANAKNAFEDKLDALLGPEDAHNYLMYASTNPYSSIGQLQDRLSPLDINAETYEKMADAVLIADKTKYNDIGDRPGIMQLETRLSPIYLDALGADEFLQISPGLDPLAASADGLFRDAKIDNNTRAGMFIEISSALADYRVLPSQGDRALAMAALRDRIISTSGINETSFDETQLGQYIKRAR